MSLEIRTSAAIDLGVAPLEVTSQQDSGEGLSKAELRRQMYERIARGNALAEVEANAHRQWHDRKPL